MVVIIDRPIHLEVFLPEGILQILRRNFPEEAAGGVALMLSVAHAGGGEGQGDRLLRPGQGHVKEPALFFQIILRQEVPAGGKQVLLHAGHIDIREFQALGGMGGHQGDPVAPPFLLGHIDGAQQRDVLQEIPQQHDRDLFRGDLVRGGIGPVLDQPVDIFPLPVLAESGHAVEELLHIRRAGLSLDGHVFLIKTVKAGFRGQGSRDGRGALGLRPDGMPLDHLAEIADLVDGRRTEPVRRKVQGSRSVQGCSFLSRRLDKGAHGRIPDAAGGFVHDALEGFVVVDIDRQFEIGHHVLDLGPLEERVPGVDQVRQIPFPEGLLEGARLGIRPVQDGKILIFRVVRLHAGDDGRGDQKRLLRLGIGADQADLLALLPDRDTVLRNTRFILGYQRVGRIHNHAGGTVIPLQPEGFRLREVLLEIQDVLDPGTAEGVDGLRVVPDHADVPPGLAELLQDQVLGEVRVLVLVHEDVVETVRDGQERIGVVAEQDVHVQEDVVEVHDPGLAAQLGIKPVDRMDFRLLRSAVVHQGRLVGGIGRRRDQVVLRHGDPSQDDCRFVYLLVQPAFLADSFDDGLAVGGVVDGEIAGEV